MRSFVDRNMGIITAVLVQYLLSSEFLAEACRSGSTAVTKDPMIGQIAAQTTEMKSVLNNLSTIQTLNQGRLTSILEAVRNMEKIVKNFTAKPFPLLQPEKDDDLDCEGGIFRYKGDCYFIITGQGVVVSRANEDCKKAGGTGLAVFYEDEDYVAVSELIKERFFPTYSIDFAELWIAGTYDVQEKEIQLPNNGSYWKPSAKHWLRNYPDARNWTRMGFRVQNEGVLYKAEGLFNNPDTGHVHHPLCKKDDHDH